MFITFEGSEGSGKTTQYRRVVAALQAAGYEVAATREPGGTPIAEEIRAVLLNQRSGFPMDHRAEALLFSAARAQHVAELIRPALAAGKIVVCDRFYDSTLAYQGFGYGLDLDDLRQITAFATGGLVPDLTVYLDCPVEEGLRRRRGSGSEDLNRLDALDLNFYRRVEQGFHALMRDQPERWVAVDASGTPDEVFARIAAALHMRGLRLGEG